MKRLILFGLILNSIFAIAQIPPSEGPDLYGTRHFISLDGADTLAISHGTDTTHLISTDSIYIHKLMNVSGGGVSDHGSLTGLDDPDDHPWALEWNDTISTIATRYWSIEQFEPTFTKNTAFNKNFGTTAGTVAEGNDSRILSGQFAYSWGDHSVQGYLTTETDPIFVTSPAFDITSIDISNWNTAYSWGDHSVQGYATQTWVGTNYLGINAKAADADKLDGLHSSSFSQIGHGHTYKDISFSETNVPDGNIDNAALFNNGIHLSTIQNNTTYPEYYGTLATFKIWNGRMFQLEHGHTNNRLYHRFLYNDNSSNWIRIYDDEYHPESDNADKLDGIDSSQFLRSDTNDSTSGWLAIGKSSNPSEALDVNGNILASGEVTADNINTTVQSLSGTTVSWDVSSGHNAKITLSGNTTITMSNLVAGTTGNLTVTNPATAYDITFSGYTFLISPILYASGDTIGMSGASGKDVLSWYYDGTQVFINGTLSYE